MQEITVGDTDSGCTVTAETRPSFETVARTVMGSGRTLMGLQSWTLCSTARKPAAISAAVNAVVATSTAGSGCMFRPPLCPLHEPQQQRHQHASSSSV